MSYQRVSRVFVHAHRGELVTLKAGEEKLRVTPNHPIWVEGQGWKPAGELEAGEEVVLAKGGRARIEAVEAAPIRGPPVLVYNLEVENTHTYFVGEEGVWVHNCSGGSPTPTPGGSGGVNLASPGRTQHILYGDATGGGHLYPGAPGKTPFPADWDPDKIMQTISDIATDPSLTWAPVPGRPGRFVVVGIRDGVEIRVIVTPNDIITGYPINLPRNPP